MKTQRISFVAICIFWVAFAFISLLVYVEDNPIRMNYKSSHSIRMLFPQGWAFFTKSPRDENIQIYQLVNGKLEVMPGQRQATFEHLMGVKRDARAMSVEYATMLYDIPPTKWVKCEVNPSEFIKKHPMAAVKVKNKTPLALLHGDIYLISQATVPWAWAKFAKNVTLPSNILHLNIQ
jgi:antimicrobial peptide system SdpA family protein